MRIIPSPFPDRELLKEELFCEHSTLVKHGKSGAKGSRQSHSCDHQCLVRRYHIYFACASVWRPSRSDSSPTCQLSLGTLRLVALHCHTPEPREYLHFAEGCHYFFGLISTTYGKLRRSLNPDCRLGRLRGRNAAEETTTGSEVPFRPSVVRHPPQTTTNLWLATVVSIRSLTLGAPHRFLGWSGYSR